ncbi:MAG TPA: RagB/SusD family nutrient uptake outer membrane protein, partial [Chitinophagaceae bacterium]
MKFSFKYALLISGGFLLFCTASCTKALKEKPFSFISPNNFYQSGSDAEAAINAVYNELYTYDLYIQPFWNLTLLDDDHVSGADWYLGTAGVGNPQSYWGVDRPWNGLYTVIARSNSVLEHVAGITNIDAALKQRILGEAYFFRGWAYFQLVQLYGGVPLRLKSISADPNGNKPRASVKEVYDAVIADLKLAEQMLYPVNDPRSGAAGRVNQGVAKAMLAKAYLTMASGSLSGASVTVRGGRDNGYYTYTKDVVAGYADFNSQDDFKLARDKALEVIQSGNYSLFPNWIDIWKAENHNKGENMWELQSSFGTSFVNDMNSYFSARSPFGTGAVWMSNNHYKNFETQDTRILDGVTHQFQANWGAYYYYPSWEKDKYSTDASGRTYYNNGLDNGDDRAFVNKFSFVTGFNNDQLGNQYANNTIVGQSDAFFPLLRYSDVLLMFAEAENEVNGPTASA